jgi:hypothetical protein
MTQAQTTPETQTNPTPRTTMQRLLVDHSDNINHGDISPTSQVSTCFDFIIKALAAFVHIHHGTSRLTDFINSTNGE